MTTKNTSGPARDPEADLAGLVASRICHDLISPLGAIGNGVELMQLAGEGAGVGAEAALIGDSLAGATSRIRLFRLAFGAGRDDQPVAWAEFAEATADLRRGGRVDVDLPPAGDLPRGIARALLLALLCAETALAGAGRLALSRERGAGPSATWRTTATSPRLRAGTGLWQAFAAAPAGGAWTQDLAPADVQFALLARALARIGRQARVTVVADSVTIAF
jgi:histidine phosphotransferase ChpT